MRGLGGAEGETEHEVGEGSFRGFVGLEVEDGQNDATVWYDMSGLESMALLRALSGAGSLFEERL